MILPGAMMLSIVEPKTDSVGTIELASASIALCFCKNKHRFRSIRGSFDKNRIVTFTNAFDVFVFDDCFARCSLPAISCSLSLQQ